MMVQDGSESTWEPINYRRFISQFQPDIITSIWQLERIKTKICVRFNQIYTYVYMFTYMYIYPLWDSEVELYIFILFWCWNWDVI